VEGLRLGAGLSAVLSGGAAGRRLAAVAPRSAGPALAVMQVVGLLLLPPPGPAPSSRRTSKPHGQEPGALRSDALRLAGNAAQTSWFWSLVAVAVGLGQPGRHLGTLAPGMPQGAVLPLAAAPLIWGALGYAARWNEPRTLQLLGSVLGLAFLLLPLSEAATARFVAAGRAALWHLLLAAMPLTAGSVGFCCAGAPWQPVAVAAALAASTLDRAVAGLCRPSWALGVVGPLAAAALCGRLSQLHGRADACAWVEGYTGVRAAVGSRGPSPDGAERQDGRAGGWDDRRAERDVPLEASARRLPASLVGELRRLTTLLLHPMPPLAASARQDPACINRVLANLWPFVRAFVEEDIIRGEVEAILQREVTGALAFDRISLGSVPVQVHAVWVVPPTSGTSTITLALDAEFDGREVDVALKLGLRLMQLSVGITKLSVRGRLFIAFRHLTPHLPLTQGLNIFFANPPAVEIELGSPSGAVSLLPSRVKAWLAALFANGVARALVLPNRVSVPFGCLWPLARLKHSRPEGLLCCRVVGACGALPPNGLGGFAASQALSCRLQLGAHVWRSAAVQSCDGDFLWDDSATLVVDDKANQELIVSLHEQQSFGSVQVTEPRGIGTLELAEQSRRQHVPVWQLPGAQGGPQLLLSATWHPLSSRRAALAEHLGSLLVVTIDCARHVPTTCEGRPLVIRVLLLQEGDEPQPATKPAALSYRMRASAVTPLERGRSRLRRLQWRNFPHAGQPRGGSAAGPGSGHEAEAASAGGFSPANLERWRERLEQMWQHFRTADNRHLSDWVCEDRDACVRTLAGLLGVGVWDEPRFGELVDEVCRSHPAEAGRIRAWTRGVTRRPAAGQRSVQHGQGQNGRSVECHWLQQLRIPVSSPRAQEALIEIAHVKRRKELEVLGSWRKPLRELLAVPRMTDPMCGRTMQPITGGGSPAAWREQGVGAQQLTLYAQLELLHLLPAEAMQRH